MASVNKVIMIGNLTRDPEVKYTQSGTAVAKMGIAVNRQYKGPDGEYKKEVQFFNVVAWGKTAENCAKYLTKGKPLYVEGRLQNRQWEQDGQKRTATEIVADMVQFLGSAGGTGGGDRPAGSPPPQEPAAPSEPDQTTFGSDADIPF